MALSPVNHDEICAAFTFSISPADNLLEHCVIVDRLDALDLIIAVLVKLRDTVNKYRHRSHGFGSSWLFKHRFGVLVSKRDELCLRSGAGNAHVNATSPDLGKKILNGVRFLYWVLEKDALRDIGAGEMEVMLLDKRRHKFSHLNTFGSAS